MCVKCDCETQCAYKQLVKFLFGLCVGSEKSPDFVGIGDAA